MFSIIIPTYNNVEYLKICINSIKKNSKYSHEIIIHINEGNDGTLDYVKKNNYKFSYSKINDGICVGCNKAASISIYDLILYVSLLYKLYQCQKNQLPNLLMDLSVH